ncbi:MAG: ABC-F family ATP-binding cassette domain-containing protein [Bacteroidota bacterium]
MIALTNIAFEFGGRYLYRNANWHIKPNERIALVGRNGTGKSTLLRVINGEYGLSEGTISKPKDLTIGFLNQDNLSFETDDTILNVTMQAFSRALFLEKEIEEILVKMETDHSMEIITKLSDAQEEFDRLDGYNMKHKCEKVLEGLGFSTAQLQQPYKKFSGGWRMRVMLAKLLLQNPDLLMLDEPTNHLDLPTIKWLEEYLIGYPGTVIVVSHDMEFLDKMTNKTVEVANQSIYEYSGNYSFYLEAKEERIDLQQRQFDNQQQFIREQERFIARFKAKASKATAAQSRVKMLDKLDKIEAPEDDNSAISIQFRLGQQSSRLVAEMIDVSKSFPDIDIVKHANARIERGDKIALIGANGKGKSTLLRIIAGVEKYEGDAKLGFNVRDAFYAQHQLESLGQQNEILEELSHHATDRPETELRTILGCFLFAGDDVFKKIKVLSGGEKARVALAKTLLTEANFLLLDEPTNHLDMRSINILSQALQAYEGTFITVSHDRHFISQIANKIWYIENLELKEYPGTYAEYEEWRLKNEALQLANKDNSKPVKKAEPVAVAKPVEVKQAATENKPKLSNNQVQKIKTDFEQAEKKLEQLKTDLAKLEEAFALPENSSNAGKLAELQKQHTELKSLIGMQENVYEKAFEAMMELE